MKTTKRIFASLLVVMLMAAMLVVPASAAGEYSITINGNATGHTYEAYQVFSGTISIQDNKKILSSIDWGTGVNDEAEGFLKAIQKISYKDNSGTELFPFASVTTAQSVADELAKFNSNGVVVDAFAAVMGEYLTTTYKTSTASNKTYTISELDAGYYLIKDQNDSLSDSTTENDLYTKYLLAVVAHATVAAKGSYPTITKRVSDTANGTYTAATDVPTNDSVYFGLIGTLPSNFEEYSTYYYKFTDKAPSSLKINPDSVVVYQQIHNVNTPNVLTGYNKIYDESTNTLTIEFADLRNAKIGENEAEWAKSDSIVVRYEATLTSTDVKLGLGNTDGTPGGNRNSATLTFSNDPNEVNSNATSTTPVSQAAVYTYQAQVTKVNTDGKPLTGAEFHVVRKTVVADGEFMTVDGNGYCSGWTTDESKAATFTSASDGTFVIKGLDEGSYWLREHKAPDGYNKLTSDVNFIIASSFSTTELSSLTVELSGSSPAPGEPKTGLVSFSVENKSGATLPETGGMGTTVLYIAGAAMMIGAAAVLVTKKRNTQK